MKKVGMGYEHINIFRCAHANAELLSIRRNDYFPNEQISNVTVYPKGTFPKIPTGQLQPLLSGLVADDLRAAGFTNSVSNSIKSIVAVSGCLR